MFSSAVEYCCVVMALRSVLIPRDYGERVGGGCSPPSPSLPLHLSKCPRGILTTYYNFTISLESSQCSEGDWSGLEKHWWKNTNSFVNKILVLCNWRSMPVSIFVTDITTITINGPEQVRLLTVGGGPQSQQSVQWRGSSLHCQYRHSPSRLHCYPSTLL